MDLKGGVYDLGGEGSVGPCLFVESPTANDYCRDPGCPVLGDLTLRVEMVDGDRLGAPL